MLSWRIPDARGPHAFLTELGHPQRQSPGWRRVCGHWLKYQTLCMVTPCQEDGLSDFIHCSSLGLFPGKDFGWHSPSSFPRATCHIIQASTQH